LDDLLRVAKARLIDQRRQVVGRLLHSLGVLVGESRLHVAQGPLWEGLDDVKQDQMRPERLGDVPAEVERAQRSLTPVHGDQNSTEVGHGYAAFLEKGAAIVRVMFPGSATIGPSAADRSDSPSSPSPAEAARDIALRARSAHPVTTPDVSSPER